MVEIKPKFMLVGEAAGPDGAMRTGIPFTDEITLNSGPIILGQKSIFNGQYNLPLFSGQFVPEKSAQRVWEVIKREKVIPLMWNAVPFYPHDASNPPKIRTPRDGEVREWSSLIKELSNLFPTIKYHSAVGRKAQMGLIEAFNWPPYIRHPSRYAKDFTSEASQFLRGK